MIGLNRFKRYAEEKVPINLIENLRVQRVFKPTILEIMNYLERMEGYEWRGRKAEDRRELESFIEEWKKIKEN